MRQRSLKNQHRMLGVLLERFDAVDVTGMTAWERARAVHGRTATGLAEGDHGTSETHVSRPGDSRLAAPSAKYVATPLFTEEEAA